MEPAPPNSSCSGTTVTAAGSNVMEVVSVEDEEVLHLLMQGGQSSGQPGEDDFPELQTSEDELLREDKMRKKSEGGDSGSGEGSSRRGSSRRLSRAEICDEVRRLAQGKQLTHYQVR